MQFQADISAMRVCLPTVSESTALGAAYLAGLAVGVWKDLAELKTLWRPGKTYIPQMPEEKRTALLKEWSKAVSRSLSWAQE